MEKEKQEWLIWSIEHDAWWRPNECGYTTFVSDAGKYTYTRALQIVYSANIKMRHQDNVKPNEAMVHFSVLDEKNPCAV